MKSVYGRLGALYCIFKTTVMGLYGHSWEDWNQNIGLYCSLYDRGSSL